MGELREVQLTQEKGLLIDQIVIGFFERAKDTTVRIYVLTLTKQIPKRLECRP